MIVSFRTQNDLTALQRPCAAMSAEDFANWLADDVLYIRPVDGGAGYAVFTGDGTFLDVVDDPTEVVASAQSHDMSIAAIH